MMSHFSGVHTMIWVACICSLFNWWSPVSSSTWIPYVPSRWNVTVQLVKHLLQSILSYQMNFPIQMAVLSNRSNFRCTLSCMFRRRKINPNWHQIITLSHLVFLRNMNFDDKCSGLSHPDFFHFLSYATLTIYYCQRVLRHVEIVSDKKKKQPSSFYFYFFLQHAKKKGLF